MAGFKSLPPLVLVGALATSTIAGTVTVDGNPAARVVLIYKNNDYNLLASTVSDPDTGVWSVEVAAGVNDRLRVVCVGGAGENSQVFDQITVS